MDAYMGVDIGTTGCKAFVFDETGRQRSGAYREYPLVQPQPDRAELNPDDVIDRCFEAISEAAQQAEELHVRTLGVSSQGEAFTVLDATGRPRCNALVSFDARATKQATAFPKTFGEERLYQITGHTANSMFSLFKLLWLRENQPDVLCGATWVLCFEDLLSYRLGVEPAMGWSLAARTMLFDVRKHEWNADLLAATGVTETMLARPLASGSLAGVIPPAIAKQIHLPEGVSVVTGGHDQICGALGAGAVAPGQAVYATGTVECLTPAFAEPVFSEELREGNLCTYDHAAPGRYASVAFSLTGGNLLKWFRDEFGQTEVAATENTGKDAYDLLMQALPDRPSDLLVLPYFTPSGTPYFDATTPGAILGLRLTTTRGEVLRGLLEGVALEMALNLDFYERAGLVVRQLRAIGGGAKSSTWTQLKADVLGRPIEVLEVTEAGCLGLAALGRAATTQQDPADVASAWAKSTRTLEPRDAFADIYRRRLEQYKKTYPVLRDLNAT